MQSSSDSLISFDSAKKKLSRHFPNERIVNNFTCSHLKGRGKLSHGQLCLTPKRIYFSPLIGKDFYLAYSQILNIHDKHVLNLPYAIDLELSSGKIRFQLLSHNKAYKLMYYLWKQDQAEQVSDTSTLHEDQTFSCTCEHETLLIDELFDCSILEFWNMFYGPQSVVPKKYQQEYSKLGFTHWFERVKQGGNQVQVNEWMNENNEPFTSLSNSSLPIHRTIASQLSVGIYRPITKVDQVVKTYKPHQCICMTSTATTLQVPMGDLFETRLNLCMTQQGSRTKFRISYHVHWHAEPSWIIKTTVQKSMKPKIEQSHQMLRDSMKLIMDESKPKRRKEKCKPTPMNIPWIAITMVLCTLINLLLLIASWKQLSSAEFAFYKLGRTMDQFKYKLSR